MKRGGVEVRRVERSGAVTTDLMAGLAGHGLAPLVGHLPALLLVVAHLLGLVPALLLVVALLLGHRGAMLLAHLLGLGPHLLGLGRVLGGLGRILGGLGRVLGDLPGDRVLLAVEDLLDSLDDLLEAPLLPRAAVAMAPVRDALRVPLLHFMLFLRGLHGSPILGLSIRFNFLVFLVFVLVLFLVRRSLVDLGPYGCRGAIAGGRLGLVDGRCRGAVAATLGDEGGRLVLVGSRCRGAIAGTLGDKGGRLGMVGGRLGLVEDLSSTVGLPLHDVVLLFFLILNSFTRGLFLGTFLLLMLCRPVNPLAGGVGLCRLGLVCGRCGGAIARTLGHEGGRLGLVGGRLGLVGGRCRGTIAGTLSDEGGRCRLVGGRLGLVEDLSSTVGLPLHDLVLLVLLIFLSLFLVVGPLPPLDGLGVADVLADMLLFPHALGDALALLDVLGVALGDALALLLALLPALLLVLGGALLLVLRGALLLILGGALLGVLGPALVAVLRLAPEDRNKTNSNNIQ